MAALKFYVFLTTINKQHKQLLYPSSLYGKLIFVIKQLRMYLHSPGGGRGKFCLSNCCVSAEEEKRGKGGGKGLAWPISVLLSTVAKLTHKKPLPH